MKKIILLINFFAIPILFIPKAKGCCNYTSLSNNIEKNNVTLNKPLGDVVYKTLNGVLQSTACGKTADFDTNYYYKQKLPQLNFWFGITVVKEIVNLIHDEFVLQASASHKVDGIRIYFASNSKTSSISILLVTTLDSIGAVGNTPEHHDYYQHSSSEPLFSDQNIAGQSFTRNECSGANLYKWRLFGFVDDITCKFKNHPHYVRRHTGRKMVKSFGSDVINTKAEWIPTSVLEDAINDPKCDGIRIYFGKHPAKDKVDSIYNNRDAFVIVTTKVDKKDNTNHIDYFDCSTFQRSADKNTHAPFIERVFSPGQDNGSLCPNNCD